MQILIFVAGSVDIVCRDYYMLPDLNNTLLIDMECYGCVCYKFLHWFVVQMFVCKD